MDFKNGIINIKAAGYNGARSVIIFVNNDNSTQNLVQEFVETNIVHWVAARALWARIV